jgi:putative transposase
MKKSRFTEEQIIGFLKQAEAGMPIKELCRKGGFSDATFYKWRSRFGGMETSDARRLKELESENAKLKKLLAEAHLDIHALKLLAAVSKTLQIGDKTAATLHLPGAGTFTKPHRPQTNGKAERFTRPCLREWAYGRLWHHSEERAAWLPALLSYYNARQPHSARRYLLPTSRLGANNLLQLNT